MDKTRSIVVCDTREEERIYKQILNIGVDATRDKLDYGDYLIIGYKKIVIERKKGMDFYKAIKTGKLWEQLESLVECQEKGYSVGVLVQGSWWGINRYAKKFSYKQWERTILKIMFSWGIPVWIMKSTSQKETAKFIKKLADTYSPSQKKEFVRPIKISKGKRTLREEKDDTLCSISGIGRKHSRKLRKKYKTIHGVAEQSPKKLAKIEGIGKKKAKHIYRVLNK